MNLVKLFQNLENELAKEVTDRKTWNLVIDFWKIEEDLPMIDQLVDRVDLLESRMYRDHGWSR